MSVNNNNNFSNNNNNNGSILDGETKQANPVVRINQDSDDNLQKLFDMALSPENSKRPLQLPFRQRNLPSSFFNPPTTGSKSPSVSHSRENSADSAFGSGTTTICSPSGINPAASRGLQISHSRAHSSPASLQQTFAGLNSQNNNNAAAAAAAAAANVVNKGNNTGAQPQTQQQQAQQQQQVQPMHMKQRSYDVVSAIQLQEELGDLPRGWEQARTAEGQIYYLK